MTRHGDAGQIAGVEMLLFGMVVFVVGVLALADAWGVIDGVRAAMDAAGTAARAYVQAPSLAAAPGAARTAAVDTLIAEGRDPARMTMTVAGSLARCSRITVGVGYRLNLVTVPLLGGLGGGYTVHVHRSELVDPYRSGLPGRATCGAG